MRMNKKGTGIADMLLFLIFFLVIFACIGVIFFAFSKINDGFQGTDLGDVDDIADEELQEYIDRFPVVYDWLLVVVLFILWAGLLISSYMIDNNPIFFAIFAILAFIIIIICIPIANFVYELTQDDALISYFNQFPKTVWFLQHWLWVIAFFIATIIPALYAKSQGGESQL